MSTADIVIIALCICALLIFVVCSACFIWKSNKKDKTESNADNRLDSSFLQDLAVHPVPIMKISIQGKEHFFIIDSGASVSCLDSEVVKRDKLEVNSPVVNSVINGAHGNKESAIEAVFKITINDKEYSCLMCIADLSVLIESIKANAGIEISGLLGSDFLAQNRSIIDFDKQIIRI